MSEIIKIFDLSIIKNIGKVTKTISHEHDWIIQEKLGLTLAHVLTRRDQFSSWQRTDEVSMENHDSVKELDSLVQQAQLWAVVKSNRGSGNCAESRTHSSSSASEKFVQDKPSAILHSEGTLPNHDQQPRTEICAEV